LSAEKVDLWNPRFQPWEVFFTVRPMDLLSKLEQRFGSWAIPNLALYLIAMQAIGYFLLAGEYASVNDLSLFGSAVINQGQWWRLLSFMMLPKTGQIFWLLISLLVFYTVGNALERQWGTFKFNLFVLTGYLLTVLASFLFPGVVLTNFYFLASVYLAFATLFPNFEFLAFFVLPVKAKWFAWIMVAGALIKLFQPVGAGAPYILGDKVAIGVAMVNFALFFGQDFLNTFKAGQRRKAFVAKQTVSADQARHVCAECGATDKSDSVIGFRYCSTCGKCYCENHIGTHTHD
jgi:hypothetical protein